GGGWLDAPSAEQWRAALDQLFQTGVPFSLLLKTTADAHLEADGRAVGAHAVLRLRDVAAYKGDLIKMLDEHALLLGELRSGRVLLDAIPMPIWLKGSDGRIQWANAAYIAAVEAKSLMEVRERQIELLEQSQRKAVAAALDKQPSFRKRMPLVINGERKAHDVIVTATGQSIAAIAV